MKWPGFTGKKNLVGLALEAVGAGELFLDRGLSH